MLGVLSVAEVLEATDNAGTQPVSLSSLSHRLVHRLFLQEYFLSIIFRWLRVPSATGWYIDYFYRNISCHKCWLSPRCLRELEGTEARGCYLWLSKPPKPQDTQPVPSRTAGTGWYCNCFSRNISCHKCWLSPRWLRELEGTEARGCYLRLSKPPKPQALSTGAFECPQAPVGIPSIFTEIFLVICVG